MLESGFVGRARELAELDRRLAGARAGRGALVLVEGEAGAGKTALAQRLVERAASLGVRVAWGACLEGEGAPAYWPWVQILRAVGGPASLLLDTAPGAPGTRLRLFDEVVEALRRASGENGLLVVVDDLHWADVPSMRLLHAVASAVGGSRLLVVALYRGREALPRGELAPALQALRRERDATRLMLPGLSAREVAELTARVHGGGLDDRVVRAVQERAEGNPLFVLELVRLVGPSGWLDPGLPDTVRDVIGRRLDALPPEVRELLRQAAVLGREFATDLLGGLVDAAPEPLLDRLDSGVAAGILTTGDASTFRFAHVLMQEVLYAELSTAARQRLHARTAEALGAAGTGGPLDALAYHLRQAAPLGRAEEALRVTRQAAERARDQLAYEHAAFQYRAALPLVPLVGGGDALRAELLLETARSEYRAGNVNETWRCCQEAASLGRAMSDPAMVADAATVPRGITNSPVTEEIHTLAREALSMIDGRDPVREARLLAQLAITTDPFTGDADLGWSERALRTAEATGDPDARFLAMQARHADLVDQKHVLERLALGERAIGLARELGQHEYAAWGHTWRIDAFWELGRRVQLDSELSAFARVVGLLREPLWRWRLGLMQAVVALYEGRFADAATLAEQAREIGVRGGHDGASFIHLVFRSHLAMQTGTDLEAVEAEVSRAVTAAPYLARTWHAHVLAGMGRVDDAGQVWETVVPHLAEFPRDAPEWIVAAAGNAELCVALNDRGTATTILDALLPYADRQVISGAHTPSYGPVSLYLGMVAGFLGREGAEDHLLAALASAKAMGSAPYEATAQLELARLRGGRTPPDPAAARHLGAALRLARRLGMGPLAAATEALRAADTTAMPLTAREEQVAALVAEGLSNRQIATRLHLSERTVENHVTHILTKLGFDSRARIAAWYVGRRPAD